MTISTISSQGDQYNTPLKRQRVQVLNARITNQYYRRYQWSENALFFGILVNLILSISYCESDMSQGQFQSWFLWAGYYFNFLCIILVLVNTKANYDYYKLYQRPKIKQFVYSLALRIIVLLPRPYPQLENQYVTLYLEQKTDSEQQIHKINNLLTVVGLTQCFFLFNYLFTNSGFKNQRSHRISILFRCKISNMWVVRGWFKRNYLLKLFAIFFAWSIICACCFRLVQYRYNPQILYIQNAVWFTFSTMFCIGYGDLVTQTNVGKWVGLVAMYTGVIFTYFSITLINNFFKLQSQQRKTLNFLNSLENRKELRMTAQKYIRYGLWRAWKNRKHRFQGIYFPQTIKQIQLRRHMRVLRGEIRKISLKKTVYGQFAKGFEESFSMIKDLKQNHVSILSYLLTSLEEKN